MGDYPTAVVSCLPTYIKEKPKVSCLALSFQSVRPLPSKEPEEQSGPNHSGGSPLPSILRENLHHSNPPITMIDAPKRRPKLELREGSVAVTSGVAVGEGVRDGLEVGVIVTGLGVNVAVAGGVTRSTNFWPGRMTEALFNPFQVMRSTRAISYQPAIHESVSPLLTV
jgi:hypothetical protein